MVFVMVFRIKRHFVHNVKFCTALTVLELLAINAQKFRGWITWPWALARPFFGKFLHGFCRDCPWEQAHQIWILHIALTVLGEVQVVHWSDWQLSDANRRKGTHTWKENIISAIHSVHSAEINSDK